tara:strand:+ start:280 stop:387 length:108 start_codon:yes stop_codon:yes gene_type:complete
MALESKFANDLLPNIKEQQHAEGVGKTIRITFNQI